MGRVGGWAAASAEALERAVSRVTEPGGHEEPGGRGGQVRQELGYFLESTDCAELVIGPDGATWSGEVRDDVAALDCPEPPELTASW